MVKCELSIAINIAFSVNMCGEVGFMRFRPCIDIHNGKVKQIIGGSLTDKEDYAKENFVSRQDAGFYARMYKSTDTKGGHIIILNHISSRYYEEDVRQAAIALEEYPTGLQIGGGITADNAKSFIKMGATHIIVTSYVFKNGYIDYNNLNRLIEEVGKDHIVLDLSCRFKDDDYYIVTDRWQKFTDTILNEETLDELSKYCDEFLIHAVDVEGKASGIEKDLAKTLGNWAKIPITYAGGIGTFKDLEELRKLGKNKLDVTIGSALSLFGGPMEYQKVLDFINGGNEQ